MGEIKGGERELGGGRAMKGRIKEQEKLTSSDVCETERGKKKKSGEWTKGE